MPLPRIFSIRESSHRIHNPLDPRALAQLGEALRLAPGASVLDLACGSGELLCTWARDHGIVGLGVDIEPAFVAKARARASELGVTDRVTFEVADAAGYAANEPVDVAACVGASWIGGGLDGTIDLLEANLKPTGLLLVGEVFWRSEPPQDALDALGVNADDFLSLPGLMQRLLVDHDVVEMVLATPDSWDRYACAQWFNLRSFLDAHPDDDLADTIRAELRSAPLTHVTWQRELLGWGLFALRRR